MNRAIDIRLRKLEAACPERQRRVFVIEGANEADRQSEINELIGLGKANTLLQGSHG